MPRVSHEIQPLGNGKFLVMGGRNTTMGPLVYHIERSCEIYDANTGTWSLTDSLQLPRSQFTSVVTTSGKILAIGGETTTDGPVLQTEVFDPATETWSVAGSAPLMQKCDAVVTTTGEILVTRYTKYYKGTADGATFTDVTPAQHVSSGEFPECIELNSGKVLCVGNQPSTNNDFG
ncbi:MAG: kelch repeat-containing protein [Owenweeksia sp.]|nr:kelch repeat-containing protein [Owenweeksia sp.]